MTPFCWTNYAITPFQIPSPSISSSLKKWSESHHILEDIYADTDLSVSMSSGFQSVRRASAGGCQSTSGEARDKKKKQKTTTWKYLISICMELASSREGNGSICNTYNERHATKQRKCDNDPFKNALEVLISFTSIYLYGCGFSALTMNKSK